MIAEFKDQIRAYKSITPDVLDRIEYKTVWSGKRIQVGDKVLYAFVYPMNSEDYKLATFLERELDDVAQQFVFTQKIKGIIPVLKYRNDNLERAPIIEEDYE
jgi:tyrosine-protein phosphatase YwqE